MDRRDAYPTRINGFSKADGGGLFVFLAEMLLAEMFLAEMFLAGMLLAEMLEDHFDEIRLSERLG
jgi:hypothetical protein